MITLRTPLFALLLAALIPVGAFSGYLVLALTQQQRAAAEERSFSVVKDVKHDLDAGFRRSIGVLQVLAASPALDSGDLETFDREARRVAATQPDWLTVVLVDVDSKQQLVNTLAPFGGPLPLTVDPESIARMQADPQPMVGDLLLRPALTPEPLVPVRVPVVRDGRLRYVLSAGTRPMDIRAMLRGTPLPASWLGVVVDRKGRIVTRTTGEAFVGQPASLALRAAIGERREGWYEGRSLEGEDYYTAFTTSPLTGWSVHLGIPRAEIDGPLHRSLLLTGLAGLASLGLAVLLAALVWRDLRRRRQAERALEQAQRAEVLGRMTGTIAHDFNNILGVLIGIFEHLQRHAQPDARSAELLATGFGAIERGRNLTQQLLAFASNQPLTPQRVDIHALITDLARLIRRAIGPSVELRLALAARATWCEVDVPQFEAALLNLAVNARDAMPDGGTLTIATANPPPGQGHLEISVTDTGHGIPPDRLDRVFDPFFTTKPPGKGTGLGLSQVQGFIRQSHGTVAIDSRVGEGTRVRLVLPCGAGAAAAAPPAAEPAPKTTEAMEAGPAATPRTVLVVEDEMLIGLATATALEEAGYRVLTAADGKEALRLLQEEPAPDVLFTDITLPDGPNGLELAEQARTNRPGIGVVICSGRFALAMADQIAQRGHVLLSKPYTDRKAVAAVADALRTAAGGTGVAAVRQG